MRLESLCFVCRLYFLFYALRRWRANVPCINVNDTIIFICRWVFHRWGVETRASVRDDIKYLLRLYTGWRVANISNKQHYLA